MITITIIMGVLFKYAENVVVVAFWYATGNHFTKFYLENYFAEQYFFKEFFK